MGPIPRDTVATPARGSGSERACDAHARRERMANVDAIACPCCRRAFRMFSVRRRGAALRITARSSTGATATGRSAELLVPPLSLVAVSFPWRRVDEVGGPWP
jgi:hypothetical protein